jgi:MFS family permease
MLDLVTEDHVRRGHGLFTDAYDLFVIGIVVSLIKTQRPLSTTQVSWLNSATLLASAVGALVFGRVADLLGRNWHRRRLPGIGDDHERVLR